MPGKEMEKHHPSAGQAHCWFLPPAVRERPAHLAETEVRVEEREPDIRAAEEAETEAQTAGTEERLRVPPELAREQLQEHSVKLRVHFIPGEEVEEHQAGPPLQRPEDRADLAEVAAGVRRATGRLEPQIQEAGEAGHMVPPLVS